MNAERPTDLLNALELVLARQADCLRRNKWQEFESAFQRSQTIADRISQGGALDSVSASRVEQLRRSYERLMLMAEAHRQTIAQQLQRLHGSRHAIQAYQRHR